ncbi:hypothetical protein BC835DRAFT_1515159 [Cytidiella melzeri]|nr:hypothetical protein BC835DRAFT_1515159 [Cytidiella melzeri]
MNISGYDYKLRGIIYYGKNHYTSCIVSDNRDLWFHKGISTGRHTEYDGIMSDVN